MAFSLYKTEKSKTYEYIDRMILANFNIGAANALIHKYLGPKTDVETGIPSITNTAKTGGTNETVIQDVLWLENRDRKYQKDLIEVKTTFQVQDNSFDLSQFGIMLSGDNMSFTFHTNDIIRKLGRKIMAGDVIEMPMFRDDALLDQEGGINRFWVVEDVDRPAEGYGPDWRPHLLKARSKTLTDSQEYSDILGDGSNESDLKNILSTYNREIAINDQVLERAAKDVSARNFDTSRFYVNVGDKTGYTNMLNWALNGDGIPPNSSTQAPSGKVFPQNPSEGDFFLRTDYSPARLFQRASGRWNVIEDDYKGTWVPANRILASFINNDSETNVSDNSKPSLVPQKQALSKAAKPKTDV